MSLSFVLLLLFTHFIEINYPNLIDKTETIIELAIIQQTVNLQT